MIIFYHGDVPRCGACQLQHQLQTSQLRPCVFPQFERVIFFYYTNVSHIHFFFLRYDAHHIVWVLGYDETDVSVLATTEEKFITFSKRVDKLDLRFIDNLKFLNCNLDQLVKNLPRDQFHHVQKIFREKPELFELEKQKGVFPYDYKDYLDKLKERRLPPKEQFYSKLTGKHITDEQFTHALRVWHAADCKTLGEYSDLYLLVDVLVLTDVFEHFRKRTRQTHKLDPLWYVTAPALSWDAALRQSEVKLDLITNYNMYLMIEKGIRGSITQVIKHFAEVDDKTVLMYLDANNLYGYAMTQYLPIGNF